MLKLSILTMSRSTYAETDIFTMRHAETDNFEHDTTQIMFSTFFLKKKLD
jgi:hypothetical protein